LKTIIESRADEKERSPKKEIYSQSNEEESQRVDTPFSIKINIYKPQTT
jgi:hypothetical protein